MSYPDFSPQGYQVISELGRNREGGRIAWLATDLNTSQQVVVKQFCFAQVASNWSAYKEHEREIQVLRGLNHPGIPKYLGALETPDGFCLIQEYKNAPNLAIQRSFEPEEIKQIAVKALEILVYLQNRIPAVIHRDIKPENILVDEQINVYLIDFGMSRIGSQELAASSVFNGTPGFIPPEQIRKPTVGSDLYGLGATLICLLTGTKSMQMPDLADDDDPYVINFRHLLPQLSPRFLNWLELMVKPRLKERFANAQTALDALKPLDVVRVPEVKLSQSILVFHASTLGEKLKQSIQVVNTMSGTMLEGKWEVAPHPQDPPHTPDSHPWIVVEPALVSRNDTVCTVLLNTSKLMSDKLYQRQLLLRTNADPEVYCLTVQVQTAPLPIESRKAYLIYIFLACAVVSILFSWAITIGGSETVIRAVVRAVVGAVIGAVIGALVGVGSAASRATSRAASVAASVGVFGAVIGALIGAGSAANGGEVFGSVIGAVLASVMGAATVAASVKNKSISIPLLLLTAGLGITIGIGWIVGLFNPYILLALSGTGLPLATMLLSQRSERRKLIAQYRKSEERLIKP
ncbi:protein kinase [Nodularia sp. LEGE 06071]|uniref:serine/threonine protein kinase n=2 Tax=unclassified Nodularia (in: cyanobacteria) TaxID=2656917 RepID=UPI001882278D|nr:serine/threonine-protein kinase [Nodularia sp. LEGE 06071]MBE9201919.1 protein kinase [Nodularia sp. LEGE 06071]